MKSTIQRWAPWAGVLFAAAAAAQPQTGQVPPPPTPLHYTSPLSGYQAYADQAIQPWREANDRVGQIGGWRAYAKESQAGATAQGTPPSAAPHAGHQHGGQKP